MKRVELSDAVEVEALQNADRRGQARAVAVQRLKEEAVEVAVEAGRIDERVPKEQLAPSQPSLAHRPAQERPEAGEIPRQKEGVEAPGEGREVFGVDDV